MFIHVHYCQSQDNSQENGKMFTHVDRRSRDLTMPAVKGVYVAVILMLSGFS